MPPFIRTGARKASRDILFAIAAENRPVMVEDR
jgi:hypothetical protein